MATEALPQPLFALPGGPPSGSHAAPAGPTEARTSPPTASPERGDTMVVESNRDRGMRLVEEVVSRWSSKYMHYTKFVGAETNLLRFETIFSLPSGERPVPIAVVRVHFTVDVSSVPKLCWQFEHESVQHTVDQTLTSGKFEGWLDRLIVDKSIVRTVHDLSTPFEHTRLRPPSAVEEVVEEEDPERSLSEESFEVEGTHELTLAETLANIFDAADEEDEGFLTHKEVADLLYATPLGLSDWDIKLLMTTAHENELGSIEYKPFVQAAPELTDALQKRRQAFVNRNQPTATITHEAMDLCFAEEFEETVKVMREIFEQADPDNTCFLSRHDFRQCLLQKHERFSPQEVQVLMQMVRENDFGSLNYEDLGSVLQQLRIDSLHNALVETDVESLRKHLILILRRHGLPLSGVSCQMPIWTLRRVLLEADQCCLSRMQVHVLLCILEPDFEGNVDVHYFLRVICAVVPHMFDAATFMATAGRIQTEKAEQQALEEMQELQGFTSGIAMTQKAAGEDDEEDQAGPDREYVEKALQQVLQTADKEHSQHQTLRVPEFLGAMQNDHLQTCKLSDAEIRGFIAEAEINSNLEIAYTEHVKRWAPVIFELRKSKVYEGYLTGEAMLANLSKFEKTFPTMYPPTTPPEESGGEASGEGGVKMLSRTTTNRRRSMTRTNTEAGPPASRSGKKPANGVDEG